MHFGAFRKYFLSFALWLLKQSQSKTRLMIYNTQISQLHFLYLAATQFHNILL